MLSSNPICPVCNYATSAVYCDLPTPEQLASGVKPLDSLPAAWWNKMWNMINCSVNQARGAVGSFITELNNVLAGAGICPNCVCTDQLYQAIDRIRQTIGNATVAGAVKSSSTPGMVSIDENGLMTANCVGNATQLATSARTLVGAVNELKTTYDACLGNVSTALGGKAPTSHASSANTYGVGTAAAYGHLRISDTYASNLGDAGMAASQTALYCVYKYAEQVAASAHNLGNIAGCPLGTASAGTAATAARSDHVHPSCSSTTLVLDVSNLGCWNEGLRINATRNGWTALVMGGLAGSCSGCTGAFSFHTYCTCPKKLFVSYRGANSSSYFEPTGAADGAVRWHGNVVGDLTGTASCAACAAHATCAAHAACAICATGADYIQRFGIVDGSSHTYTVALFDGCGSDQGARLYASCQCLLRFDTVGGILYACTFCGTASYATCAGSSCNAHYALCAACATSNGKGVAFGTAATCDATAFRSCTWVPSCVACATCACRAGLCCCDGHVWVCVIESPYNCSECMCRAFGYVYVCNTNSFPVIITNPKWSCCGCLECIYSIPASERGPEGDTVAMGDSLIQIDGGRCVAIGVYGICTFGNLGGHYKGSRCIPYRILGYAN